MTARILSLPENAKGRDFVVGDIHGAFDLLDEALRAVRFDPAKDRLIAVGDLIDRGSRSADCLYYMAQPWFFSVRGNHEQMFLYLYRDGKLDREETIRNIRNGMGWMLDAKPETLQAIYAAITKLPVAIEVGTPEGPVGFIHGDVPPDMDWETFKENLRQGDEPTIKSALLSRRRLATGDKSGVAGVLRVFSGHTVTDGGPKKLGNCFFMDTGGVFKLMDAKNARDLYLTLAEIRANAEDICNPAATKEKLVRTAVLKKERAKPPKPPSP